MTVAGTSGEVSITMLIVTLFVMTIADTVTDDCDLLLDVNTTSNTLLLTCTCNTSDDVKLQRLHINRIDPYTARVPLAWINSNNDVTMSNNAQNFTVVRAEFQKARHYALIELEFDLHHNHKDSLKFECIATGFNEFHEGYEEIQQREIKPSDYYTTTTTTTATTTISQRTTNATPISSNKGLSPVEKLTGEKSELSIEILAMIITFSLVIVSLVVFIIVILTARRRRQSAVPDHPPAPCRLRNNGVPWDVVKYLMAMNSAGRHDGHDPPTPPHSCLHQGDSIASGSYAECVTPTITFYNMHGSLSDVGCWDDVSRHATERKVVVNNEVGAASNSRCIQNDAGTDERTWSNTAVSRFVTGPSALLSTNPTPLPSCSIEQNPRRLSPITTQIPPLNFENVPSPVSPPSPELQRLPMAPSPPRDFCSTRPVPAEAEADVKQFSETQLWGGGWSTDTVCGWKDGRGTAARGLEGGGHEASQLNEGPVRLDEGPMRFLLGRASVFDRYNDSTYLTTV